MFLGNRLQWNVSRPPLGGRRKFWSAHAPPADPSSLSSLSQYKDHLRELLTFAVLSHFRNIRPGSGSTFVNSYPEQLTNYTVVGSGKRGVQRLSAVWSVVGAW